MDAAALTAGERWSMRMARVRAGLGRRWRRLVGSADDALAARWRAAGAERRTAFYAQAWCDAAAKFDVEATVHDGGMIELRRGDFRTWVAANYTPLDNPAAQKLAEDKPLVQRLLTEAGVPIPAHCAFTRSDPGPALAFLAEKGTCVVKPAHGTGAGQGVCTQIRTRAELLAAIPAAGRFGPRLMIEEQIPGDTYRFVVLDGELLDVTRRSSPTLTGDGERSVRELVLATNDERMTRGPEHSQTGLFFDAEMTATLRTQGLTLQSVPDAGQVLVAKHVVNENDQSHNTAARDAVCEELTAEVLSTATALGIRIVGIDVITEDPTRPLSVGGVVLEANTGPGFHYHYHRNGGSYALAVPLLEAMLR